MKYYFHKFIINNSNAILMWIFRTWNYSFQQRLEKYLLNLLTNATKYSKTDCVPIISIYSKIVDGNKQLIISDNGIGFDMDKVKR
jgi:signal transduction histidine kinase